MNTIVVKDRAEWRTWLAANHAHQSEVWLVYHKKHTGKSSVAYGASVEEALCFGWVDSLIKRLDDSKYARKFTPRKENSQWSPSNILRAEKMMRLGLMTEPGLQMVAAAKRLGTWQAPARKPTLSFEMPVEFAQALKENPPAAQTFNNLAPTYQKQYLGWIEVAKRPETRAQRIQEAIHLLVEGKKLGLR